MSTMKRNQTVYYGPSTGYPSVGSVNDNESVTACWREGSWVYIEYNTSSKKKRGYVPQSSINLTGYIKSISNKNLTRYVNTSCTTYTGPSSSRYATAGSLSKGEEVKYIGEKISGYAFVEYDVSGKKKKRAWVYANYLNTAAPPKGKFYDYLANGWSQTLAFNGHSVSGNFGHLGNDLYKSTKDVKAIYNGEVVFSGYTTWNGNVVQLKHTLNNKVFYSFYAHLASRLVSSGSVSAGQSIGVMGGTGNGGKGYSEHLHLGIYLSKTNGGDTPGYYRDSHGNKKYFESGAKYKDYTSNGFAARYFDPEEVISSNGEIIIKNYRVF